MGIKEVFRGEWLSEMILPTKNDVVGTAVKLLGFDRNLVKYQDCQEHLCCIQRKMKQRVWIKESDIVLVSIPDLNMKKVAI